MQGQQVTISGEIIPEKGEQESISHYNSRGDGEFHFVRRKIDTPKNNKIRKNTQGLSWKQNGSDTKIKEGELIIGYKRTLTLQDETKEVKLWEFTLADSSGSEKKDLLLRHFLRDKEDNDQKKLYPDPENNISYTTPDDFNRNPKAYTTIPTPVINHHPYIPQQHHHHHHQQHQVANHPIALPPPSQQLNQYNPNPRPNLRFLEGSYDQMNNQSPTGNSNSNVIYTQPFGHHSGGAGGGYISSSAMQQHQQPFQSTNPYFPTSGNNINDGYHTPHGPYTSYNNIHTSRGNQSDSYVSLPPPPGVNSPQLSSSPRDHSFKDPHSSNQYFYPSPGQQTPQTPNFHNLSSSYPYQQQDQMSHHHQQQHHHQIYPSSNNNSNNNNSNNNTHQSSYGDYSNMYSPIQTNASSSTTNPQNLKPYDRTSSIYSTTSPNYSSRDDSTSHHSSSASSSHQYNSHHSGSTGPNSGGGSSSITPILGSTPPLATNSTPSTSSSFFNQSPLKLHETSLQPFPFKMNVNTPPLTQSPSSMHPVPSSSSSLSPFVFGSSGSPGILPLPTNNASPTRGNRDIFPPFALSSFPFSSSSNVPPTGESSGSSISQQGVASASSQGSQQHRKKRTKSDSDDPSSGATSSPNISTPSLGSICAPFSPPSLTTTTTTTTTTTSSYNGNNNNNNSGSGSGSSNNMHYLSSIKSLTSSTSSSSDIEQLHDDNESDNSHSSSGGGGGHSHFNPMHHHHHSSTTTASAADHYQNNSGSSSNNTGVGSSSSFTSYNNPNKRKEYFD
ncbi:hypothetical protein DFA_02182 [Cavenderia fasciculata]|uniref:Uncharacterized protein n=1 Tax=Cavenderia fasciculata TaxID=261658 RepID=F4PYC8_CACFS|nr:uncharacterized protein DFA_02182 [Cavenderia fasciculata]EGG19395.1 hypothetical protein DFA_02182 [Cavenderia fasciculata]|eukprot:XP_004357666.1 hypothetical protein DFA_02182 [Cavenderia fasciculata]